MQNFFKVVIRKTKVVVIFNYLVSLNSQIPNLVNFLKIVIYFQFEDKLVFMMHEVPNLLV